MLRRKKERRIAVAQSINPAIAGILRWQRFRWKFGAGDQRPIVVQMKRQLRLIDFKGGLGEFICTIQKIRLIAQR